MQEANRRHEDPIAALLEAEGGKKLFTGKIIDVGRRTTEGFLRGSAMIEGSDADRGSRLELSFQNEWIVAWRGEEAIATSPDLICVLDSVNGHGVGTETVRYGQRVTVVALPAPAVLTSPRASNSSARAPSATTSTTVPCSRPLRLELKIP